MTLLMAPDKDDHKSPQWKPKNRFTTDFGVSDTMAAFIEKLMGPPYYYKKTQIGQLALDALKEKIERQEQLDR